MVLVVGGFVVSCLVGELIEEFGVYDKLTEISEKIVAF